MITHELNELRIQLKEILNQGLIKPSLLSWGATMMFLRKTDGTIQFCIDYQYFKWATIKNMYFIPWIDDLLIQLKKSFCIFQD
jgi:hypothetical protein